MPIPDFYADGRAISENWTRESHKSTNDVDYSVIKIVIIIIIMIMIIIIIIIIVTIYYSNK